MSKKLAIATSATETARAAARAAAKAAATSQSILHRLPNDALHLTFESLYLTDLAIAWCISSSARNRVDHYMRHCCRFLVDGSIKYVKPDTLKRMLYLMSLTRLIVRLDMYHVTDVNSTIPYQLIVAALISAIKNNNNSLRHLYLRQNPQLETLMSSAITCEKLKSFVSDPYLGDKDLAVFEMLTTFCRQLDTISYKSDHATDVINGNLLRIMRSGVPFRSITLNNVGIDIIEHLEKFTRYTVQKLSLFCCPQVQDVHVLAKFASYFATKEKEKDEEASLTLPLRSLTIRCDCNRYEDISHIVWVVPESLRSLNIPRLPALASSSAAAKVIGKGLREIDLDVITPLGFYQVLLNVPHLRYLDVHDAHDNMLSGKDDLSPVLVSLPPLLTQPTKIDLRSVKFANRMAPCIVPLLAYCSRLVNLSLFNMRFPSLEVVGNLLLALPLLRSIDFTGGLVRPEECGGIDYGRTLTADLPDMIPLVYLECSDAFIIMSDALLKRLYCPLLTRIVAHCPCHQPSNNVDNINEGKESKESKEVTSVIDLSLLFKSCSTQNLKSLSVNQFTLSGTLKSIPTLSALVDLSLVLTEFHNRIDSFAMLLTRCVVLRTFRLEYAFGASINSSPRSVFSVICGTLSSTLRSLVVIDTSKTYKLTDADGVSILALINCAPQLHHIDLLDFFSGVDYPYWYEGEESRALDFVNQDVQDAIKERPCFCHESTHD